MVYVYPYFGKIDCGLFRLFGPGLGNCLFPWARSIVFAQQNNMPVINPTWPNISFGAILRNQTDKRFYGNLFKPLKHSITGIKKHVLLATSKKIWCESIPRAPISKNHKDSTVYLFKGMDNFFADILDNHQLIKQVLVESTRSCHQSAMQNARPFIAAHVRMGDFAKTASNELLSRGAVNQRIPLAWYAGCIQAIRTQLQTQIPALIFSDGTDSDLHPLLGLPSVMRAKQGSALADLLALSHATILITSGSTFSMWASYLGRMPVIWHPGQLRQRIYAGNTDVEIEFDGRGELPGSFGAALSWE